MVASLHSMCDFTPMKILWAAAVWETYLLTYVKNIAISELLCIYKSRTIAQRASGHTSAMEVNGIWFVVLTEKNKTNTTPLAGPKLQLGKCCVSICILPYLHLLFWVHKCVHTVGYCENCRLWELWKVECGTLLALSSRHFGYVAKGQGLALWNGNQGSCWSWRIYKT